MSWFYYSLICYLRILCWFVKLNAFPNQKHLKAWWCHKGHCAVLSLEKQGGRGNLILGQKTVKSPKFPFATEEGHFWQVGNLNLALVTSAKSTCRTELHKQSWACPSRLTCLSTSASKYVGHTEGWLSYDLSVHVHEGLAPSPQCF